MPRVEPPAPQPQLPAGIAQQLADDAFARGEWQEAYTYYVAALTSGEAVVDIAHCLLFGARCALYLAEHKTAIRLLTGYTEAFPGDAEGFFYLGRTYQGMHRDADALTVFNAATLISPGKPKYLVALAQTAHSLAFGGFGFAADANQGTYASIAKTALTAALAKDAANFDALAERMMLELDCGEIDKGLATAKLIADGEAKHGREKVRGAMTRLGLALARGGLDDHIRKVAYLKTYPAGRRILSRLKSLQATKPAGETAAKRDFTILAPDPKLGGWGIERTGDKFAWLAQRQAVASPADALSLDVDLVSPVRPASRVQLLSLAGRLMELPGDFAGIVEMAAVPVAGDPHRQQPRALLVRKKYWNELTSLAPDANWNDIAQLALSRLRLYTVPPKVAQTTSSLVTAAHLADASGRQRVVVLSRHGPRLVGGGEQFLRTSAGVYAEGGAEVLFAGLSKDWSEASTEWPAGSEPVANGFVYDDVDAFRAFCLTNAVTAVHVISGLGEFVLDACRGLNVRIIYGVHFWREFIPARVLSQAYYPNVSLADAKPLTTMQRLLERADFAYVNSDFCADIARTAYDWSPPIIYSVPITDGNSEAPPPVTEADRTGGYVLLANARADKGWYLLLDIAARLPDQMFVAIASQSDTDAALAEVAQRGLRNVQILDRTDRMEEMYDGAAVVLVPSFTFVETFSRVVIEAGRRRRPVLMADSGNLTYLGAGTDLVLANDPDVWTGRIARLVRDAGAYADAVEQTAGIADRHSGGALAASLSRLPVSFGKPRVLVCVGSGIGNICHTTPLVSRLHKHFGAPIDVLVAGDFPQSSAVMAGAPAVGQVFEQYAHVAQRSYDLVLVTHSFGSVVPSFNAPRVLVSRDVASFEPAGEVHEVEFNLAFTKHTLGIDYDEADTRDYFFGGIERAAGQRIGRRRVALHAGSKGGIWASKRWPGFAQLAGRLIADGFEVVSVGIKDEYVEGTIDMTGLTIARMAEEISACDAMISNDSGVMNVANALGVPIVAVFGPTNPATRGPRHSEVRILAPHTDCSPCEAREGYKSRFTEGKCQCIGLVGVNEVLEALYSLDIVQPGAAAAE
jgi:ADP-heptose:LPS heptosyltransferase